MTEEGNLVEIVEQYSERLKKVEKDIQTGIAFNKLLSSPDNFVRNQLDVLSHQFTLLEDLTRNNQRKIQQLTVQQHGVKSAKSQIENFNDYSNRIEFLETNFKENFDQLYDTQEKYISDYSVQISKVTDELQELLSFKQGFQEKLNELVKLYITLEEFRKSHDLKILNSLQNINKLEEFICDNSNRIEQLIHTYEEIQNTYIPKISDFDFELSILRSEMSLTSDSKQEEQNNVNSLALTINTLSSKVDNCEKKLSKIDIDDDNIDLIRKDLDHALYLLEFNKQFENQFQHNTKNLRRRNNILMILLAFILLINSVFTGWIFYRFSQPQVDQKAERLI